MPTDGNGDARLRVRKTYKLAIGGAFPRSESGRSYPVYDASGELLAHAAQASRKDVRDAVVAARKALPGWTRATAYNRGQVIYRVAEMLDGRRDQFAAEVAAAEGLGETAALRARRRVDRSHRLVRGLGRQVRAGRGIVEPDRGSRTSTSRCRSRRAWSRSSRPQDSSLLGFVSALAPVLCTGNTAVVVTSEKRPLPAVSLVRGARDVGSARRCRERADRLHGRAGSVAREPPGRERDRPHRRRTRRPRASPARSRRQRQARVRPGPTRTSADEPGIERLTAFVETKTVWHPIGI